MKTLIGMKLMAGQEETISLSELRKNPGDVFSQVQMGKTFSVTKNGIVIATIATPEPNAFELGAEARRIGISR